MPSDKNEIKAMTVPASHSKVKLNVGETPMAPPSPYFIRSKTISVVSSPRGTSVEDRRRYSADSATLDLLRKARRSRHKRQNKVQQLITRDNETPYQKFRRISKTVRVIATICLGLKRYVKVAETKLWSLVEMHLNLIADMETSLAFDRSMFAKLRVDRGSERLKSILAKGPERRQKEEIETVLALLRGNKTFGHYSKETQISLAKVMHFVTYEYRRIILKEGHKASGFYIILSGTCLVNQTEVDKRRGTTFVRTVDEISNGDAFGGEELLNDTTRRASYVCKECVELLLVDKENFQKIIREPLEKERDELIEFCKSQEIFCGLPVEELRSNHSSLTSAYYRPETVVLHNVSEAGHIAIIKSGKCKVIAEIVESIKQQNKYRRINECSGGKDNWKATAALTRTMSLFEKTKMATIVPYNRNFGKKQSVVDNVEIQNKTLVYKTDEPVTSLSNNYYKSTYAQIAELGAGSVFGLDTILRKTTKNKLSLISEGADCILVSKKFFKHEKCMNILKTTNMMAIDFPQSKETFTKIREGRAWVSFKDTLVKDILEGKSKKVVGIVKE